MSSYVISREADRDLDDLWDYIAADNVDAADRLTAKLMDAFEALARLPGMGHKRDDLTTHPVLFWPVGNYLVVYRAERSPIEIVAIVHGARDIPTFLLWRRIE
jgi:plasmid stabilization system protein ParE